MKVLVLYLYRGLVYGAQLAHNQLDRLDSWFRNIKGPKCGHRDTCKSDSGKWFQYSCARYEYGRPNGHIAEPWEFITLDGD